MSNDLTFLKKVFYVLCFMFFFKKLILEKLKKDVPIRADPLDGYSSGAHKSSRWIAAPSRQEIQKMGPDER